MKYLLFLALFGGFAHAADTKVSSSKLVTNVLMAIETVSTLDGHCTLAVDASSKKEGFATITLTDDKAEKSLSLTLKASAGTLSVDKSGNSAVSTTTYSNRAGNFIAITTFEDISDTSIDLKVGNDSLSCKFTE